MSDKPVGFGDFGNSDSKVELLWPDGTSRKVSFSSIAAALGTNPPDIPAAHDPAAGHGFVFRWNGKYYAVGDVADSLGGRAIIGGDRYKSELWQALVAGSLCALLDESSVINLTVATPLMGGEAAEETIQRVLEGVYKVKLYTPSSSGNTGQRTIHVENVATMRETEGAYYYYLLDERGYPRPDEFYKGLNPKCTSVQDLYDNGLVVVDGGGWTLDYLPVNRLAPDFARGITQRDRVGLNWVTTWFQNALQSHPVVGGGGDRPREILRSALVPRYTSTGRMKFEIKYGQRQVNVVECVQEAVGPLDLEIAKYVLQFLNGGVDNAYILLTGGAAEAAFPWLEDTINHVAKQLGVTNHTFVLKPDTAIEPWWHNVEGMKRRTLYRRNRRSS